MEYREGVFVGYRGYDANGVKPLFPFGFGLSYSSFDYSNLSVVKDNDSWLVSFDLKNTGKKDAAEVAQVYVGCVNPTLPRPLKELKGFEKVFLKHGESRRIQVKLDSDSFSYYDMDRHQFVTVPGSYLVQVGGSSVSLPLKEQILIPWCLSLWFHNVIVFWLLQINDGTQNVLDTDFEKVRKFLVSKNNILKFRKRFKYGLRASALSTCVL